VVNTSSRGDEYRAGGHRALLGVRAFLDQVTRVAAVVAFLASAEAGFVTGQVI
jgi:NAD(P)-dependent dehydrogenase (short-subunit alcohol dehydrogenase family)